MYLAAEVQVLLSSIMMSNNMGLHCFVVRTGSPSHVQCVLKATHLFDVEISFLSFIFHQKLCEQSEYSLCHAFIILLFFSRTYRYGLDLELHTILIKQNPICIEYGC